MVKDLLSFSDCGLYFAYFGPDGKLKLWDTGSGILKQEYVPNLHLNSPCTTLLWITVSSNHLSPWKSKKRKVEESSNKIIALGAIDGSIALYSLSEGNVVSTLKGGHSNPVSSLSWSKELGLFSSSSNEVVHWDVSNKKVKSKWKCGKNKITCLAVSEDGEYFITGSYSLSLWKVNSDDVLLVRTYTGHSSDVVNIVFVNNQYFLSCALEDRHISVWSTKTDCEEPLGRFSLGDNLQGNISFWENNSTVYLCATTRDGALHFFNHQLNGKVGKLIKPHENIEIATDGNNAKVIPIVSARISSESSASIAYGHPPFFSFEPITFSESKKKRTCLIRNGKTMSKPHINNKVINSTDDQAEYVGSGVRRKTGEDVAMEERLVNLSLGKPVVSDKLSPNNLSNLLMQGLESKDKSLLDSVLFVKDVEVINETVSKLPVSALPPLIAQLSTMIQGKTFSSVLGCMWLKGVMRQHSGQLLASQSTSSLLASIQSLIESRLAILGPLRSLSGRLEHIVSQLGAPQGQPLNSDQSVLVYHDEESSDDGESLMVDGEGSESEEKWDELTDDQLDTETS